MRIIVPFNLKSGTDTAAYEEWARTRDLPGVRSLVSVLDFQIYRATGLLGGEGKPAFAYIGVIDIDNMEAFDRDISTEAVRKLSAEFEKFADAQFILTETLSDVLP